MKAESAGAIWNHKVLIPYKIISVPMDLITSPEWVKLHQHSEAWKSYNQYLRIQFPHHRKYAASPLLKVSVIKGNDHCLLWELREMHSVDKIMILIVKAMVLLAKAVL